MRKVICDRCGAEMADEDERFYVNTTRINGSGYDVGHTLDLCPNCNEQLMRFLDGEKLEDKE